MCYDSHLGPYALSVLAGVYAEGEAPGVRAQAQHQERHLRGAAAAARGGPYIAQKPYK